MRFSYPWGDPLAYGQNGSKEDARRGKNVVQIKKKIVQNLVEFFVKLAVRFVFTLGSYFAKNSRLFLVRFISKAFKIRPRL